MKWGSLVLALLLALPAPAEELLIVTAPPKGWKTLDRHTLDGIYRRRIQVDTLGRRVVPINLPVKHPLRGLFSHWLFHRAPEQMVDYWNRRYFEGVKPPYVLASQQAVVRFLRKVPGAIGYVSDCQQITGLIVLERVPLELSPRTRNSVCGKPSRPGE